MRTFLEVVLRDVKGTDRRDAPEGCCGSQVAACCRAITLKRNHCVKAHDGHRVGGSTVTCLLMGSRPGDLGRLSWEGCVKSTGSGSPATRVFTPRRKTSHQVFALRSRIH